MKQINLTNKYFITLMLMMVSSVSNAENKYESQWNMQITITDNYESVKKQKQDLIQETELLRKELEQVSSVNTIMINLKEAKGDLYRINMDIEKMKNLNDPYKEEKITRMTALKGKYANNIYQLENEIPVEIKLLQDIICEKEKVILELNKKEIALKHCVSRRYAIKTVIDGKDKIYHITQKEYLKFLQLNNYQKARMFVKNIMKRII